MSIRLSVTAAGRAALANNAMLQVGAVEIEEMRIGSGLNPSRVDDDARTGLRIEKATASVVGGTANQGERIGVRADFTPAESFAVTEMGLFADLEDGSRILFMYWCASSADEAVASAKSGSLLTVGALIAVTNSTATITVTTSPTVQLTAPSLPMVLPRYMAPPPHIGTADHRITVTAAAATNGGTVSIPASVDIEMCRASGSTREINTWQSAAWQSADLDVDSTYYLRANISTAGAVVPYVSKGADTDGVPSTEKGTPDAAAGGGFDSTPIDILVAKIVTGDAGTAPTVTALANAARLVADATGGRNVTATGDTTLITLDWARTPVLVTVTGVQRANSIYQVNALSAYVENITRYGYRIRFGPLDSLTHAYVTALA